MTSQIRDYNL